MNKRFEGYDEPIPEKELKKLEKDLLQKIVTEKINKIKNERRRIH